MIFIKLLGLEQEKGPQRTSGGVGTAAFQLNYRRSEPFRSYYDLHSTCRTRKSKSGLQFEAWSKTRLTGKRLPTRALLPKMV